MSARRNLKAARKRRHKIASELNALSSGRVTLIEILEAPSASLGRVRVFDVLRRTPKLGEAGAKKICQRAEVWPTDRLVAVPLVKRRKMIELLPERVPRERTRQAA